MYASLMAMTAPYVLLSDFGGWSVKVEATLSVTSVEKLCEEGLFGLITGKREGNIIAAMDHGKPMPFIGVLLHL